MKKKIGIVTYFERNYGSGLQAYALSSKLEEFGYDPLIIKYEKSIVKDIIKKIYFKMYIVRNNLYYKTIKKMDSWNLKNLKISPKYYSLKKIQKVSRVDLDAVICGSDQVWNNKKKINPFYYLQFAPKEKRIAYAPSMGRASIAEEDSAIVKRYIDEINFLSVREKESAEFLESKLNREIKTVLDPTLLIEANIWKNRIKSLEKPLKEKYIFVYLLTKNSEYYNKVKVFARENNFKIIDVGILKDCKNKGSMTVDHFEFLNLINNAEYVFTDSFHGAIFSIIFQKQFMIFKRFSDDNVESQNIRIYNLLKTFKLEDRLIEADEFSKKAQEKIGFDRVKEILQERRKESEKYLKESLESVIKEG